MSNTLTESEWSKPVDDLRLQITSAPSFKRHAEGWTGIEVTCTITNSGATPADVTHLARLYVVDSAGVTNRCQRREDVASMLAARPTIAPGRSTSWVQDGQTTVDPGVYDIFAVWDGSKNLKSPPVQITIK